MFNFASISESNPSACADSYTFYLYGHNGDITSNCNIVTSDCSFTLHTDGISAPFDLSMSIDIYRTSPTNHQLMLIPFELKVLDCINNQGLAFNSNPGAITDTLDAIMSPWFFDVGVLDSTSFKI